MLKFFKIFFISLFFECSPAYACGPGAVFTLPTVWLLLVVGIIPLAMLKTFIYRQQATKCTFREIFYPYLGSHLLFTMIVIPLIVIVWAIVVIPIGLFFEDATPTQVVHIRSAWDYVKELTAFPFGQPADAAAWSFVAACLIQLGIFFFFSSLCDLKIVQKDLLKTNDTLLVKQGIWRANAIAYALLFFIALGALVWTLVFYHGKTIGDLYHETILGYTTSGWFF